MQRVARFRHADDEPARRAASRHTCCKQKWTLIVINLRPN